MPRRLALLLAPLAMLAGCAAQPEPTPAPPAAPAPQAAAPAPSASADGRFAGTWRVQEDRGGQCRSPTLRSVELTLQAGQARLVDRARGLNGRGTVAPDGRISVSGSAPGGPFTFRGEARGERVVGELANRRCVFVAELQRRA